jgi:hypothetical protein
MVTLPLGTSDWRRATYQSPFVQVRNRFFEENPTNQVEGAALLARPALQRWLFLGTGPVRGVFSQPGSFDGDLFAVSDASLYRITKAEDVRVVGTGIFSGATDAYASMTSTAAIGSTPEVLYLADGQNLWSYVETTAASSQLVTTTPILTTQTINIGGVYYAWTSGGVDAGTPAGTLANPWLVALGVDNRTSLALMASAINLTGTAGVTYSLSLPIHPTVTAFAFTTDSLSVRAKAAGVAGNSIVTQTTVSGAAWSSSSLGGGADEELAVVDLPDGLPAISVAFIAGYVIVVCGDAPGFTGRFFWIEPGERFIRPSNFATAERSPDPVYSVRVIGDQFWLLGQETAEVWYATGDFLTPFIRVQGQTFSNGVVAGTDAEIRDSIILVDDTGVVYRVTGGGFQRMSNNSIEERIRKALKLQN